MKVLFVVEAGYTFGLGHLLRCRPLLLHLLKEGHAVSMWLRGDPDALKGREWPPDIEILHSNEQIQPQAVIDTIAGHLKEQPVDWVILDGYDLKNLNPYQAIRSAGCRLMLLDDLGELPLRADALLNQNVEAHSFYKDRINSDCQLLLGPRYALIDRQFLASRLDASPDGPIKRVLVSFGGVDRKNRTQRVLDILQVVDGPLELDVVLGAYYPFLDQISQFKSRHIMHLHRDVPSLAPLMGAAGVMISAGGSTVWQACCTGIPLLALQTVDNQRNVIATLMQHEAALCLDVSDTSTCESGIAESPFLAFWDQLKDVNLRRELSLRAKQLVDGRGPERVAAALQQE